MGKLDLIFLSLILAVIMLGVVSAITCQDADYNKDNVVNVFDLLKINQCLQNSTQSDCAWADLDKNGKIESADVDLLRGFYLQNCTVPTPVTCTDSDSGVNYYVKGTAKSIMNNGQVFEELTDVCSGATLKEGYCYNDVPEADYKEYSCPNGCSDGKCLCPTTKCSDGTVYGSEKCEIKDNTCVCPSCPPKPIQTCTDSDNGINYYEKGYIDQTFSPSGRHYDSCVNASVVEEWSCIPDGTFRYDNYVCPQGCKDGACIKGEQIKEQVTCIFKNSEKEQKCYTAYENERAVCSGIDSCVASILGYKGEQITWKSSCGQYQYTTMDGNNEKVGFECSACMSTAGRCNDGTPIECKLVEGNCVCSTCPGKLECKDSDGGKNIFERGITWGLDWGSDNKVEKKDYCITEGEKSGRLAEYFCSYINGEYRVASESFGVEDGCYSCSDGACQQIIVKPVCGNGICESGEGDVCSCPETKAECSEGKCTVLACKCYVACPQDCKKTEGIYANLNEKFKLQVYQPVKIVDGENHLMKITFKDLIAYKCEEGVMTKETKKAVETNVAVAEAKMTGRAIEEVATTQPPVEIMKCIGAGPKALLDLDMIVNNELGKHMILNLGLGEKKQIDEFSISFLDYDYASRTGIFLVNKETFSCKSGCKCDGKGRVIECYNKTCKEREMLCTDGICREKCNIISEDCKFGCMYEGKCFPMGVRSKGLYCSDDLIMNQQREGDKACENNFECSSNVCISGKCISSNFIEKIMSWFRRLFGGE